MEKIYDIKIGLWDIISSFRMEFGKEPAYITIDDHTFHNNKNFEEFRTNNKAAFKEETFCEIPLIRLRRLNNLSDNHVGLHIVPFGYKLVKNI